MANYFQRLDFICVRLWTCRFCRSRKLLLQTEQQWTFSPVWIFMCRFKLLRELNLLPHMLHFKSSFAGSRTKIIYVVTSSPFYYYWVVCTCLPKAAARKFLFEFKEMLQPRSTQNNDWNIIIIKKCWLAMAFSFDPNLIQFFHLGINFTCH